MRFHVTALMFALALLCFALPSFAQGAAEFGRVVTVFPSEIPYSAPSELELARDIASASVRGFEFPESGPELVLEGEKKLYEFSVRKTGRILFIFPVSIDAGKIVVDVESGTATHYNAPWFAWLIFA